MVAFQTRPGTDPTEAADGFPRFAAIDIGTNTVKMTIVARRPDGGRLHVQDAGATPRLGAGIESRTLHLESILRTVAVLRHCRDLGEREGVESIVAVGTAALREALNRDTFLQLAADAGVAVEVLSGDEEARLSALAVRSDPRWAEIPLLMVLDIGGGSTEVIFDNAATHTQSRTSLRIGAVRLTEAYLAGDPPEPDALRAARKVISDTYGDVHWPDGELWAVGVGGTIVNMGAVALHHRGEHERAPVHGSALSLDEVRRQIALYASLPDTRRREVPGLDPGRSDVILAGALLVEGALAARDLRAIQVSCRGLRWGVLYDRFGRPAEPA